MVWTAAAVGAAAACALAEVCVAALAAPGLDRAAAASVMALYQTEREESVGCV